MATVFDVADFFIDIANMSEDDQMTNLKLNKLLYYAQGVFLARTGKPLFDDDIEAWDLGPVVSCIYQKYKTYGRSPIDSVSEDYDYSVFDENELETLIDVMREFGQFTGSTLVTKTHRPGTPWSEARIENCTVLNPESIREYFLEHPVPRINEKINSETVTALPLDWYDPAEDTEWEAYL